MSSLPMANPEYAYFRLTGPGRQEGVTAKLGLSPSEAWNA
jgi:hypothetical protein